MRSPNSQVSQIGMILAIITMNSTVARRNTNSATKDGLKGKPVKHRKIWMVRIAKNESVNFLRRMQRDANLADFICPGASDSGVSIVDEQHQAVVTQEIWNVIVEMGTIYAEVAKFRVEEYTAPETAEQLGIAEGTVKSRLRKIQKRIREYLDDEIPR